MWSVTVVSPFHLPWLLFYGRECVHKTSWAFPNHHTCCGRQMLSQLEGAANSSVLLAMDIQLIALPVLLYMGCTLSVCYGVQYHEQQSIDSAALRKQTFCCDEWRKREGKCPQDIFLLCMTLRERGNIGFRGSTCFYIMVQILIVKGKCA